MQSEPEPELTVVVLTRDRVALLRRALGSLDAQQSIRLVVKLMVDDCQTAWAEIDSLRQFDGAIARVDAQYCERRPDEASGPGRVAALRINAVESVQTEFCAFLDDDNCFEPDHYALLLEAIHRFDSPAAHSWRSMWTSDGEPYVLVDKHPWAREDDVACALFDHYEGVGIYESGSNVIRDRVVPHDRDRSMVDTSEWLFRTPYLRSVPFCLDYDEVDWQTARAEDSKMLDEIVASGVQIPSSKKATLRYFLGGYSNNANHEAAQIEGWRVKSYQLGTK